MNILEKVFAAGRALRAGESLKNPASWKNVQNTMNSIGIIIAVGLQFAGIEASDSQVNAISYGVATVLGLLFNIYFNTATTDKIGLPNSSKTTTSG